MNQKQLNQLPTWPQRQDSVSDQMTDLKIIANRLGLYDAADAIGLMLPEHDKPICDYCKEDEGKVCILATMGLNEKRCKKMGIIK